MAKVAKTDVPPGLVRCRIKCPDCGDVDEFVVPRSGLDMRSRGVLPEEAFPDLHADRISQLRDHRCSSCRSGTP